MSRSGDTTEATVVEAHHYQKACMNARVMIALKKTLLLITVISDKVARSYKVPFNLLCLYLRYLRSYLNNLHYLGNQFCTQQFPSSAILDTVAVSLATFCASSSLHLPLLNRLNRGRAGLQPTFSLQAALCTVLFHSSLGFE
jgi:hypothetical protein